MKRTKHIITSAFLYVCMIVSCMVGFSVSASAVDITTWAQLQTALNTGGTITLTHNITATASDTALEVPTGKTVTLDLAGHTID